MADSMTTTEINKSSTKPPGPATLKEVIFPLAAKLDDTPLLWLFITLFISLGCLVICCILGIMFASFHGNLEVVITLSVTVAAIPFLSAALCRWPSGVILLPFLLISFTTLPLLIAAIVNTHRQLVLDRNTCGNDCNTVVESDKLLLVYVLSITVVFYVVSATVLIVLNVRVFQLSSKAKQKETVSTYAPRQMPSFTAFMEEMEKKQSHQEDATTIQTSIVDGRV